MSDSLGPYGLQPSSLLSPWASPGKNTKWLPCPSPGDLPNPGTEPTSPVVPALQADSLPLSPRVSPRCRTVKCKHVGLLCFFPFLKKKSIYLAVSGLNCSTWDLPCITWDFSVWRMDSLVEARGLSCCSACGILIPWPRIKPESAALQGGFLATGPSGKSVLMISCF